MNNALGFSQQIDWKKLEKWAVFALVCLWATAASAGSLPWDNGLRDIGDSLVGKVAPAVGIAAIALAGILAMMNVDVQGTIRGTVSVVIILGVVAAAATLVGGLSLSGGLVP